jgi:hypothetical protein
MHPKTAKPCRASEDVRAWLHDRIMRFATISWLHEVAADRCRRPPNPERTSIGIERPAVVALESGILRGFLQHAIADDEHVELIAHEAAKCVFSVHAIGSPRTLKLVLTRIGQPVSALKRLSSL